MKEENWKISLYIIHPRYEMLNAYQQINVTKFGTWIFSCNQKCLDKNETDTIQKRGVLHYIRKCSR